MKSQIASLCFLVISFCCITANSQTKTINPPNGLEYGMTYSDTKSALKEKDIQIDFFKRFKETSLPEGFVMAKVANYEILGQKTFWNYAVFNAKGGLCAFQITFRFASAYLDESKKKALQFWNDALKKVITDKYSGEGFKQHNDPNPDGETPELAFRDEPGNEIGVFIVPKKYTGTDVCIIIFYNNEEIRKVNEKEPKINDQL